MRYDENKRQLSTWVYVSDARLGSADETTAISEIAVVSRARNQRLGVTGALLFTGQRFAQWLEGPDAGIEELKSSILRDKRHTLVTTISRDTTPGRQFRGWSLVYSGPSRYIASFLDRVELGPERASSLVKSDLIRLFGEFARNENRADAASQWPQTVEEQRPAPKSPPLS